MTAVLPGLYRFTEHVAAIDLSFHQYLLTGEEPLLVHTGDAGQTARMLPALQEALEGRPLSYVFLSHFEADECGGLSLLLERYPKLRVLCSEVSARQLSGFGLRAAVSVHRPADRLTRPSFELAFLAYPSEMHLWEGLVAFETTRGLLFSADLFIRFGLPGDSCLDTDWQRELDALSPEQVPDPGALARLKDSLAHLKPRLVLPGHGPCLWTGL